MKRGDRGGIYCRSKTYLGGLASSEAHDNCSTTQEALCPQTERAKIRRKCRKNLLCRRPARSLKDGGNQHKNYTRVCLSQFQHHASAQQCSPVVVDGQTPFMPWGPYSVHLTHNLLLTTVPLLLWLWLQDCQQGGGRLRSTAK